jgi:hypothetical protein
MSQREPQPDHPAPGVPDHDGALDAQRIQRGDERVRLRFQRESGSRRAAAVPRAVDRDDAREHGEAIDLSRPHVPVHEEPVQQHHGGSPWRGAAPASS